MSGEFRGRQRRPKGDGGVSRRHDHPTCHDEDGNLIPDHDCRGRWSAQLELPRAPDGSRRRWVTYARTREEVEAKLADRILTEQRSAGVDNAPDGRLTQ